MACVGVQGNVRTTNFQFHNGVKFKKLVQGSAIFHISHTISLRWIFSGNKYGRAGGHTKSAWKWNSKKGSESLIPKINDNWTTRIAQANVVECKYMSICVISCTRANSRVVYDTPTAYWLASSVDWPFDLFYILLLFFSSLAVVRFWRTSHYSFLCRRFQMKLRSCRIVVDAVVVELH